MISKLTKELYLHKFNLWQNYGNNVETIHTIIRA